MVRVGLEGVRGKWGPCIWSKYMNTGMTSSMNKNTVFRNVLFEFRGPLSNLMQRVQDLGTLSPKSISPTSPSSLRVLSSVSSPNFQSLPHLFLPKSTNSGYHIFSPTFKARISFNFMCVCTHICIYYYVFVCVCVNHVYVWLQKRPKEGIRSHEPSVENGRSPCRF